MNIPVYENYQNFRPPARVRQAVIRMVESVHPEYLTGLDSIVLTNSEGHRAKRSWRLKGKKLRSATCEGLYHPASAIAPAWIEVLIDNTLNAVHPTLRRIPPLQDVSLGGALFHEIGHHIDRTTTGGRRDRESAANEWQAKLSRLYFRKRYWYLTPLVFALRFLLRLLRRH